MQTAMQTEPPISSTAHDSDTAGREDVSDLRAQNSALQESLAHAEGRATAAQSRADAAEHELKVLREKGEEAEKGIASVVGGDSGGVGARRLMATAPSIF
jgi:septal ring factor EnvC (AmiA/AmiB activator)